jgi:hypothetical protein
MGNLFFFPAEYGLARFGHLLQLLCFGFNDRFVGPSCLDRLIEEVKERRWYSSRDGLLR